MKLFFVLTATLLLPCAPSFAATAPANLCGKYLPCGTFQGPFTGSEKGVETVLGEETMTISSPNRHSLIIAGSYTRIGDSAPLWKYALTLALQADGSYAAKAGGETRATGICATNGMCTYAFKPASDATTAGTIGAIDNGNVIVRTHARQWIDGSMALAYSKMELVK